MLENVKNLKSHDKGRTFKTILEHLEELGYFVHHTILNSLDFGVPQKRERTIIVGFKENIEFLFPKPTGIKPNLLDILEDDETIDQQYFVSEKIRKKRFEISTSSAKFQDNLFEENAIPPQTLETLAIENQKTGVVEAYIYKAFEEKHLQLENALNYCLKSNRDTFDVKEFLGQFWNQPGLKRSLDKIFEIVVYSLFEVLTKAIEVKVDIYYDNKNLNILNEFSSFAEKVLNLDAKNNKKTLDATKATSVSGSFCSVNP